MERIASGRFLEGTQARVVELLRPGGRTVEELARTLALTGNAVRGHLAALERDGLVAVVGRRPSGRKPALVYGLTPRTERLLSRAYLPLLQTLLAALHDRNGPAERQALMLQVGRRLAASLRRGTGSRRERLAVAAQALEDLGGSVRVETRGRTPALTAAGCPLADVVVAHPEVCRAMEALVSEVAGIPVREHCDRGTRPRCSFVPE